MLQADAEYMRLPSRTHIHVKMMLKGNSLFNLKHKVDLLHFPSKQTIYDLASKPISLLIKEEKRETYFLKCPTFS